MRVNLRHYGLLALLTLGVFVVAASGEGRYSQESTEPSPRRRSDASVLEARPLPFPPRAAAVHDAVARDVALRRYRVPGEFERQAAIVLGCRELATDLPDVFAELVRATRRHAAIVALVSNIEEHRRATQTLAERRAPSDHVHYAEAPHDTMWSRDYGPITLQAADGRLALADAEYDFGRPRDDEAAVELARLLGLPLIRVPMRIDGGNLLSNGEGLLVATWELVNLNLGRFDEPGVRRVLRQCYGGEQVVFLEPLLGEPTGHVDMFAAFTSPDTVVVASCDPQRDPANAEILDRNAELLRQVRTPRGRLRVARIPLPASDDGVWRSYTNVIFANGLLLVPSFAESDPAELDRAMATYARLLPGWRIATLDVTELWPLGGALHCVSLNLGPLARLPEFPEPRRPADPRLEIFDFDVTVRRPAPFGAERAGQVFFPFLLR